MQLQELIRKIRDLEQQQELNRQQLNILKNELRSFLNTSNNVTQQSTSRSVTKPSFSIEQFIGLKLLNFVGIIVLLIGIVIGVKFAVDKNLISPLLRIILAYLAGIVLFALSFFLHKKYEAFSAILFSGAAATFYFTTYGAFEFYGFLSRPFTFSLMVLLTISTVWISLRFNRQEIAILALVGAYGIPFLVGGDSGNIAALFTYLFVINCGILFISFRKNWEWLKYLSFGFSWLILLSWLVIKYDTSWFNTGMMFSAALFIQFTITICGFNLLRSKKLMEKDYFLLSLLSVFFYSAVLLLYKQSNEASTYANIALALSFLHFTISAGVYFFLKTQRSLSRFYLLAGIVLLIIFIPVKYDGILISVLWIIAALLLFIAGFMLKISMLRFLSFSLFAITIIKLAAIDSMRFSTIEKIITWISIGAVLLVISFLYQKYKQLLFGKDEQ
ncbi:DUF2339 domain-containing protein [Lacibacter sp.]|uniref:DUF2339 domain-containing protein n=1 Tax=Lacibacter sp. TaxID=1915409 RepID=UPI002B4B64E1|nr:DUF2339 domain-containing protein [Lacibacter sp.]HLP39444.1 DUF2339 domain-containing protein [Lacibacter sp.]